jgi:hypothetical protein
MLDPVEEEMDDGVEVWVEEGPGLVDGLPMGLNSRLWL